ncbi:MAG: riboflavin kinase [Clostridiales bacterium]|nr:riboflavin kinase [Clostridiales bacterium]
MEQGGLFGQGLGFPTANLSYPADKHPVREGVYGGYVETEQGTYPAIINFGARPTFDVAECKTEAYLDGFSGDLYGQTVRVYPTQFYRPIEKFESREALIEQLQRDIQRLRSEGEK